MTDTPIAADPAPEAAPAPAAPPLPPFTPEPVPKSGYADPTKVHRKVTFANPIEYQGKTYAELYLRKLTVGQVRVCVNNAIRGPTSRPESPAAVPRVGGRAGERDPGQRLRSSPR